MSYSIEEADLDKHKSCLLDLWKRNFKSVFSGRYEWIYEKNPEGAPVVFVLKHVESISYVGSLAMFPRIFFFHGKKIKCYVCGDMIVDVQHRTLGPAISLMKAAIQHCKDSDPCILITFPNEKSEPVVSRLGFKILGEYHDMTRVLRFNPYLLRHVKTPVTRLLSVLLDSLNKLRYDVLPALKAKGYEYEISHHFDKRFNDLWLRQIDGFSFIGERNSPYLNWRIKDSPYQKNKVFLLKTGLGSRSIGYISYTEKTGRIQISDMGFDGDLKTLRYLFCVFSRLQMKQGNISIVMPVVGHSSLIGSLKRAGFSKRGAINNVFVYSSIEKFDLLGLQEVGNWYMTSADNDI